MNEATRIRTGLTEELGASSEEFQNLHEFVRKARANLNQNAWDYIVGAAETETTMLRNRMALDEIAFRPRCCATSPALMRRSNSSGARCGCRYSWRRLARLRSSTLKARPPA